MPEIERSGDLAEHIAIRATGALSAQLTSRMRGLIEQMGDICVEMWRVSADAFVERDATKASWLSTRDDELDLLHKQFITEAASAEIPASAAMDLALLGRFYERLGDHAVHVAERIRYLAGVD